MAFSKFQNRRGESTQVDQEPDDQAQDQEPGAQVQEQEKQRDGWSLLTRTVVNSLWIFYIIFYSQ
jgi:hypothetical protein